MNFILSYSEYTTIGMAGNLPIPAAILFYECSGSIVLQIYIEQAI
jgi:hypothetical protein